MARLPALFINHGGGPLPLLGKQPAVAHFLSSYAATLPARPRAVLVVTAHWEADVTTVSCAPRHSLIYDYGGFPPESYEYKYPAAGSPEIAARISQLLDDAGLPHKNDPSRGWDHGVFVPMMLMFPSADVPVVQLSLTRDQDAATQLAVGRALQPLRDEGILIVGSGASFHNFEYFFARDAKTRAVGVKHSRAFDDWLVQTMTDEALTVHERHARLVSWRSAPSSREAHPPGAGEHFLPAVVVAGAGGDGAAVRVGESNSPDEVSHSLAVSQFEFR